MILSLGTIWNAFFRIGNNRRDNTRKVSNLKSINYIKYRILLKVGKESRKVYIKKCFEGK